MRKNKVLAVILAVLMVVTLLPSMVFAAAAPTGALEGKLKVKGVLAVGSTLSADYSKVKPEGITDDNVNFSWSLKDGDLLTEVGTDKTYKITEKDQGLPIVLKITGKEGSGLSGELTVTTLEVSATEEEAKALEAAKKTEKAESETSETEEVKEDETGSADDSTESVESTEEDVSKEADTPEDTEDSKDTEDSGDTDASKDAEAEQLTYSASASTADGSGVLNFGTKEEGYEEAPEAQYVTITNTGTGDLNFKEIAPENFMAQDINDQPLKSGETVTVYVAPRKDLKAGEYKDLITYQTEEGAEAFFEADFTVTAADAGKDASADEPDINTDAPDASVDQPDANTDAPDANADEPDAGKASAKDGAPYELTVDQTELTFEDLAEGESESKTVTITNTGTETVTLIQPQSEEFDILPVSDGENTDNISLDSGEYQMFTIQPKSGIEWKEDPYELTFSAAEDDSATVTIEVSVKKKAEPQETISVKITPESKALEFESKEQGYDAAPEAQTVTVTNSGTKTIRLNQPTTTTDDYTIGSIDKNELSAGESATFTVQPKTGLQAGDHNDRIQITDEDGKINDEISVTFKVTEPAPAPGISVDPESLEFGTAEEGYKEAPKAQTVTVTNTGNTKVTLLQPEDSDSQDFVIGALSKTELEVGDFATFTIQPAGTLPKGEYLKDISVSMAENAEANNYVNVHFSVTGKKTDADKNNLTGIKKPSDIKDLPNGTEKTQQALKLPDTVKIVTTKGEQSAAVKWDVKGCTYDPSSSDRQTFNVKGTVTLPDGVKNPDKISTVVAVSVTVNEYKGKAVSASDNKITGIDPKGQYDTNTKISFTAVGAGMDNNEPKKGDTRYQPKTWKITKETRTFEEEKYTGAFRVAKPGEYTLHVTFGQQKYDGSKWKDTGTQAESSVTFTVSQAKILTATPSPSVTQTNQKSAVQTGDTTPILTFVIVLIVAAGCIGGIIVYRRKKK